MKRNPKLDKIIKKIRLKENQILEIVPEKGNSIYYRFELQPLSRISKLKVYCEKSGFDE